MKKEINKKCQGMLGFLFGHKYVGYYDYGSPEYPSSVKTKGIDMWEFLDSIKSKTFVKSVCSRCGKEIKR